MNAPRIPRIAWLFGPVALGVGLLATVSTAGAGTPAAVTGGPGHRLQDAPRLSALLAGRGTGSAPVLLGSAQTSGGRDVDPDSSWYAEGDQADAQFGESVATAGDVNGDGYSDVIVGARFYGLDVDRSGAAFVYLGSPDGPSETPDWIGQADQTDAGYGESVASAGDVNGDGFGDVIIGAPYYSNGESSEGRAYVYLGSASGLAAAPVWVMESNRVDCGFGESVATAGDVNGDGYDDIIIGAPGYAAGEEEEGRAYCFLGSATGISGASPWRYESNEAGAQLGHVVAPAGDVDGDGYGDVIIGAWFADTAGGLVNAGRAYVFRGSAAGLATQPVWTGEGSAANDRYGQSVATAGDVNGDGYADILVGVPNADVPGSLSNCGVVRLYLGSVAGPSSQPLWSVWGQASSDMLGWCVAPAGDVNGDLYSDVLIGTPSYHSPPGGAAFIYEGSASGLGSAPVQQLNGPFGANFGHSLATAGDVDGDGFSDILIGAPFYTDPESWEGAAFVYRGSAVQLSTTAAWSDTGYYQWMLGSAVGTAGDVNGDGYSDILAGAPWFSPYNYAGCVYEYHGSAEGPSEDADWQAVGDQYESGFGCSAATAGDVNGDGYSDVIIGAYAFDTFQNPEIGKIYIYHGSDVGLSSTPATTILGTAAGMRFGFSVASAGDVNGDGYGDVIVGAPMYPDSTVARGAAYVFLGSASGISTSSAWRREGNAAGVEFGYAVASAGDVNGDGYSDVIVGAPGIGGTAAGHAFLYFGSASGLATVPAWSGSVGQAGDAFGAAVSSAGDMNGDGFGDVIIGAPDHDGGGALDNGMAIIYLGSTTGLSLVLTTGVPEAGSALGYAVGRAGDVNGDGYGDAIVSSPFRPCGSGSGAAYVLIGTAEGSTGDGQWMTCGPAGSRLGEAVGTAGDVNGDGFDDVVVGAPGHTANAGRATVYFGNGRDAANPGLSLAPLQMGRNDEPIAWLGSSDSETDFQLHVIGRSAAGRTRVRMEWNVGVVPVPLVTVPLHRDTWVLTSAPSPGAGSFATMDREVRGLAAGTFYHWRMRAASRSPFFPHTPWLSMPSTVPSEKQVRTAGPLSSVATRAGQAGLKLECAGSNPFGRETSLAFFLPERGPVRLSIHDAGGRCVATVVDEVAEAGRHVVAWDGHGRNGAVLPAGVYFARLQAAGGMRAAKVVLLAP